MCVNDGRDAVRVRVSEDLIFDCENANTPLHGKSTKIFITLRIFITLMFRDHQCINNSNFLLSPDFVKVGYRGKEGGLEKRSPRVQHHNREPHT